jgi:uncharacterized protein (TIGR03083 family)
VAELVVDGIDPLKAARISGRTVAIIQVARDRNYDQLMAGSLPPILTAHLFEELDHRLLELLESISPDEWRRPTVVPSWNVKQIAAHLLDTALRRLSLGRDHEQAAPVIVDSDREIADLVNGLNAKGVETYGRLSPPVLISLTRVVVSELHEYLKTLDPMAPATIGVSWAGERQSLNWFDVARELTERWHHQQQIRMALGRPGILTPRLYGPVVDCFMRGLPHAYRSVTAAEGDVAAVEVTGAAGGVWHVVRDDARWCLTADPDRRRVVSRTTIPEEIAWQLFTKALSPEAAHDRVTITGDPRIGVAALRMVAIVA